jgi:hypothetical protein
MAGGIPPATVTPGNATEAVRGTHQDSGQSVDMAEPLAGLIRRPVIVAPMTGGPATQGLVIAATGATLP